MRFRSPAEAKAMRKDNAATVFTAGLIIAAFVSIPIVNLATPLFGMAFMVHMHKRLVRPAAGADRAGAREDAACRSASRRIAALMTTVFSGQRQRSLIRHTLAARFARQAGVAAVQDQPVMGVQHEFGRDHLLEPEFDLERSIAGREPGAVADAKHVGIDRHGVLAKGHVEHDIGGLAAGAGQRLDLGAGARHLATEFGDQLLPTAL